MDLVLFEDGSHCVVAAYLSLVARVLQIVLSNVLPYAFDCLGPRKLLLVSDISYLRRKEFILDLPWFHDLEEPIAVPKVIVPSVKH